jgi:hypothetical protein
VIDRASIARRRPKGSVRKSQINSTLVASECILMVMSRRPAGITQADVRRIIHAAKMEGAYSVEVRVGETVVVIRLRSDDHAELALHEAPVL